MAVNYEQMKTILLDNERVKITSCNKYMGLHFTQNESLFSSQQKQASEAKKLLFNIQISDIFWLFSLQRYL